MCEEERALCDLRLLEGVCCLYKPKGLICQKVINRLKYRILDTLGIKDKKLAKSLKLGHGGTLDPIAEGVLPIGVGRGCKKLQSLLSSEKGYIATLELGVEHDTLDNTGKVVKTKDYDFVTKESLESVIKMFIGTTQQIPPLYSAIKYNGKRLYRLARENGEIPEIRPRNVTITSIQIRRFELPTIELDIDCHGGTYIRSLIRDISEGLGTVGTMTNLVRYKHGPFCIDNSGPVLKDIDNISVSTLKQCLDAGTKLIESIKMQTP